MKDWISNDETLSNEIRKDAKLFAVESKILNQCQSICTSAKHLKIDDPRVLTGVSLINTAAVYNLFGPGPQFTKIKVFVDFDGTYTDFSVFAQKCIDEWNMFFTRHQISIDLNGTSGSVHFDILRD